MLDRLESDDFSPTAEDINQYRWITESCFLSKLSSKLESSNEQFGFKKSSSTDQCIFLLKERIRRYVELSSTVYTCFLDASKAFDRVCYPTLFLKLLKRNIPVSVVKFLKY